MWLYQDFPGGPVFKTLPFNKRGASLIPGQGAETSHNLQPKNQNIKQMQHVNKFNKDFKNGTSLVVQWLRLCAPNAGGLGSILGQGTKFHMLQLRVHMLQPRLGTGKYINKKKLKKKKDFKNDPH